MELFNELWASLPASYKLIGLIILILSNNAVILLKRKAPKREIIRISRLSENYITEIFNLKNACFAKQITNAEREIGIFINEILSRFIKDIAEMQDTNLKELIIDKFNCILRKSFHACTEILKTEFKNGDFVSLENGVFEEWIKAHTDTLAQMTIDLVKSSFQCRLMTISFDKIESRIDRNRIQLLGRAIYVYAKSIARKTDVDIDILKQNYNKEKFE